MIFFDDFFKRHPLLLCTLKKSADVFAKLVLCASYAVCGVTALALAVYGVFALGSALAEPVRAVINAVWNWTLPSQMFTVVAGVLATIPWYVYVGIGGVAAVPVYSWAWCVSREFSEEDWDLKAPFRNIETAWHEGILWTIVYIPSLITEGNCSLAESKYAKFVVFIRAYLHYRKRMKEERK